MILANKKRGKGRNWKFVAVYDSAQDYDQSEIALDIKNNYKLIKNQRNRTNTTKYYICKYGRRASMNCQVFYRVKFSDKYHIGRNDKLHDHN